MTDPTNATSVALSLLLAVEGLAKQWDDEGKREDAALLRARGPRMAAGLSELIADNPETVLPIVQELLTEMIEAIDKKIDRD
ncbi:hypothetical protein [Streptomyces sp. NEAU-S7GS2]|uniref:hypothetical protein n=1 Tax=Streptomyces sp. NEAU-S7GS2 TaxID=2202000 RepID=UPI000D6EF253|nr:hypothetical protein [Streptomyces sp. NEAU-S7GS2]AWN32590.1 hypothetical protein DKG71_42175 [Streptomyces sp. NEAU-S7GS2]